jgi:hypothetical protein
MVLDHSILKRLLRRSNDFLTPALYGIAPARASYLQINIQAYEYQ